MLARAPRMASASQAARFLSANIAQDGEEIAHTGREVRWENCGTSKCGGKQVCKATGQLGFRIQKFPSPCRGQLSCAIVFAPARDVPLRWHPQRREGPSTTHSHRGHPRLASSECLVVQFRRLGTVRVPRRGAQFHVPGTGLAVCASLLLGAPNVLRACSELDCVEYLFISANGSVWARDRPPTTSTHYTAIRCLRRNSRNVHASVPDEHTFVLLQRRQLIRWSCHATDSYFHSNEHGWPVPSVDCHGANPRQLHPHRQR